jgi:hypothetical protein
VSTFVVSNLNDSGAGSLRAAIAAANADASGNSTISFAVNGTITLASDLPAVTRDVIIDGTSAPTHGAGQVPVVELDSNGHAGLVFAAGSDGSQLLGLAICDASGSGVELDAGSVTLNGDYIGLDLTGAAAGNAGDGVLVSATSAGNLIGSNATAASGVVSNVISGNGGNGISFSGSSSNTLVDNYIGTDPTGTVAIANGGSGIRLTNGSNGNEIGGTAFTDTSTGAQNDPTGNKGSTPPVFVVPPLGNLVSGNTQNGILIDSNSRNNVLNGNFVGTTADGNGALGNGLDGVAINGADDNSLIGCTFEQNPFVYYNVISGNGGNGLHVTDSDRTTVQANFFGTGADNTTIIGNQLDGILVDGSSMNTLVGGPIPLGNVSAGNGQNGIEVRDTASFFTSFNTFGGLLAFKGAAPNHNDGILITSTGGNQTLQTNVFSGNLNNGIEIAGDAFGVTVDPVIVGLDTNGQIPVPNGNNGLQISDNAHDNIIGGQQLSLLSHNIFSANGGYGIAILDHAHDNWIFNSYVGTEAGATAALGNQLGGILIADSANHNKIGDVVSVPTRPIATIVSGNTGNGITLESGTSFTQVLNNIIGFDINGAPLPNTGQPIAVNASNNNTIVGNQISYFATPYAAGGLPNPETIAASAASATIALSGATITASSGDHMLFVTGSRDTLSATGGQETVQQYGGNANTIQTGAGNDMISLTGTGNAADAGAGQNQIYDSGTANRIVLPAAGNGFDDIFGPMLLNGDTLDMRAMLQAAHWNGDQSVIGNYLHAVSANNGHDTMISVTPNGSGSSYNVADLHGVGAVTLSGLLAHSMVS